MTDKTEPTVQDPNAGNGVEDPLFFSDHTSLTRLPALTKFAGGENEIGPIADVFFASGYFPGLTPAQIAVQIFAGRSLGLDDAQSIFDLEIKPGADGGPATVHYRSRQTYQEAADAIEAEKAGLRGSLEPEKSEADRITPKAASPAAGSNVVVMPGAENANKGPSIDPFSEKADDSVQAPETTNAAGLPRSAGPINENPSAETETAPDPGPGVGAVGDETPVLILHWRTTIATICDQMKIDKKSRIEKFDAAGISQKKSIYKNAIDYRATQQAATTAIILTALKNDGKITLEQQKGFFLYAGVGLDPANWDYPETVKAEAALSAFLGGKPPKAA